MYGAWSGGTGSYAVRCGDQREVVPQSLEGNATDLALRVNRNEIVLNDNTTGAVWDLSRDTPVRIYNWSAFTAKNQTEEDDEKDEQTNDVDRRPPLAKPDSYGVRPGRTTVLHPLDNDSAPEGRLLSIIEVSRPTGGARAQISPDGQTIVLTMPEDGRPTQFDYFIDYGRADVTAHATITVDVRGAAQNNPPAPRQGYEPRTYKVPAGGAVSVPVLAEWRDDQDGDTVLLESAQAVTSSNATARTTADGRIRFSAPTGEGAPAQTIPVTYRVSDGRSTPVEREIEFEVQGASDQSSFAPVAEPDVLRGEVGSQIKIRPLLNDLAGSDPAAPNAELALGGRIPQQPGLDVKTDLDTGTIVVEPARPGTYFIDYDAAYGLAPLDKGTIRLDVLARKDRSPDPIAMPDTLTIFGQAPGLVDVLSNDLDPSGGLLVVQRATATSNGQLDVAIVDGRWLRISARVPDLVPATQTVNYVISNGTRSGVRGEVVVTQRPEPADNRPVTVVDRAIVRAGSSITVPVLDNDSSPSGDRLMLTGESSEGVPGELDVIAPIDVTYEPGRAYLAGRTVRYVAPSGLKERDTYEVPYVAVNAAGDTAGGRLMVTVVPDRAENTAPEPPAVEARSTSGQVIKVRVPHVGVDDEGDPVTVTGIVEAPSLGRVVRYGGNFIEYQSYPRSVGTDSFSYAVADPHGAVGIGTARIAVVGNDNAQPPLAVNDTLAVEPGRTAWFDPLANDFVAPGDRAAIELVDPPVGVRLDPRTNLVSVEAPATLDEPARTVVYTLTNGLEQSRATMTLETREDHDNPPVVYDAFGRANDSGSVVVNVLEGAYDPDGPADGLRVESVVGEPEAVIDGGEVQINRTTAPKVVPVRVVDSDGSAATASVYVPPTGAGFPYVDPDALVTVDPGETVKGSLTDLVVVPEGSELRVTGRDATTSPLGALSARTTGDAGFSLSAAPDYRGPGALLVEVTTATDESGNEDVADISDGATAVLSIPVQVGDDRPELTCPATRIPLTAGQSYDVDLAAVCKVWTVDPRDAAALAYSAEWRTAVEGVSVGGVEGSVVRVVAADDATEGGDAVLRVRAGSSNVQEIGFRLAQAPPPRMLPVPVPDLKAGESRTIDLAPYLESGVSDPDPRIVSVTARGAAGVRASTSGSQVTLSAGPSASGRAAFEVVMSDIASSNPPDSRVARGRISFSVGGLPGQPGAPVKVPLDRKNAVAFDWTPPTSDGGATISHYVLQPVNGGKAKVCRTTYCIYPGVQDGVKYRFHVRAVNKVGAGPWSEKSLELKNDTRPGRPENIRMISRGDGFIEVGWSKPVSSSEILEYTIQWQGSQAMPIDGSVTSYTAGPLDNNRTYTFTIRARNKVAVGSPRTSDPMQSLGTPQPPGSVAVTDLQTGDNRTRFRVSWPATAAEGPGPTTYTVFYGTGGTPTQAVPGCQRITGTTCAHDGIEYDGETYTYGVRAYNQPGKTSAMSSTATRTAIGKPAQWGDWTVTPNGRDNELVVRAVTPDPRAASGTVDILVDGRSADSFTAREGQAFERIVRTSSNQVPAKVELRLCNSAGTQTQCSDLQLQWAQSYGPLRDEHIQVLQPVADGKLIRWTIAGTSNGDAAILGVRLGNGAETAYPLAGNGDWSVVVDQDTGNYLSTGRISVRLYDNDPAGRGWGTRSAESLSGMPPPPGITAVRGAACTDDESDQVPGCRRGPYDPYCNVASCAKLSFEARGWLAGRPITCWISASTSGWFGGRNDTQTFDPADGLKNTDWYFGEGYATLTCQSDIQGPVSSSYSY